MEETPPASVARLRAALAEHDADHRVIWLDDSARTAPEAAAALGLTVGQIVNSLIFVADDEPVLVLASGRHRVDTDLIAAAFGVSKVGKADADIVRAATGYAIGGVAPVGHPAPLRTLIDVALGDYDEVWAAGGHPHWVYPTTFAELVEVTGGTPTVVAND
jgi:prolyl-tRNA editing enzyme YbaK/EbsC (Cys-tRNA(Pro) deacylase)